MAYYAFSIVGVCVVLAGASVVISAWYTRKWITSVHDVKMLCLVSVGAEQLRWEF